MGLLYVIPDNFQNFSKSLDFFLEVLEKTFDGLIYELKVYSWSLVILFILFCVENFCGWRQMD